MRSKVKSRSLCVNAITALMLTCLNKLTYCFFQQIGLVADRPPGSEDSSRVRTGPVNTRRISSALGQSLHSVDVVFSLSYPRYVSQHRTAAAIRSSWGKTVIFTSLWTRLFAQSSTQKTAIYSLAYIYIKQVVQQINSWTLRHKYSS